MPRAIDEATVAVDHWDPPHIRAVLLSQIPLAINAYHIGETDLASQTTSHIIAIMTRSDPNASPPVCAR